MNGVVDASENETSPDRGSSQRGRWRQTELWVGLTQFG